jgi:enediyne biosynthesis protein E7
VDAADDGPPGYDELSRFPYARRTIDETLRLYPPGWLLTRRSIAASSLGGFDLPAGTDVLVSPYLIHRHPGFWAEPETFDPDRFLPDAAAERNRFAYLPFGLGPRACIGEHLAIVEMHAHAVMLARRFALSLVPGQTVEIEPQVNLRTRQPVHVHVKMRR